MAVVPVEIDGVVAYRRDFEWARGLFVHRQSAGFGFWRLANLASRGVAFFVAGGAWAGVA